QEKQNLNRYMQRDVSVLEEKHRRTERKALGILGRGPSEKSTAARLVKGPNYKTSALSPDVNSGRLSDKEPASGFKRVVNQ
ncbi:MAG: hypothetical protein ABH830_00880, partial [Patescibacteria group bacterium]